MRVAVLRGRRLRVSKAESQGCPEVEVTRCTGCGRCVSACPERLFTLEVAGFRKHALLNAPGRCTGCFNCLAACPVGALAPACGKQGDPKVLP